MVGHCTAFVESQFLEQIECQALASEHVPSGDESCGPWVLFPSSIFAGQLPERDWFLLFCLLGKVLWTAGTRKPCRTHFLSVAASDLSMLGSSHCPPSGKHLCSYEVVSLEWENLWTFCSQGAVESPTVDATRPAALISVLCGHSKTPETGQCVIINRN